MTKQIEEQFVTFVREHKQPVYLLAYSYVHNEQDALDVVQESIQKAWKALPKLRDAEQLKSWFYQIVVRTAIDLYRKQKRVHVMEDEQISYFTPSQQDHYEDLDMQKALHELPLRYREVVVLRYFEDMKIEDVADVLGMPLSTAKSRLYKALKLLKITLQEDNDYEQRA